MLLDYVIVNGKKFRKGYTTGSCAAAAAKAATFMLTTGQELSEVEIDTPAGIRLKLPITDVVFINDSVSCSVVKDGGDDPDVTNGLKIFAEARFTKDLGVSIKGGQGVGVITFPGLKAPVGQPAINPVPLKMINKEVLEVLPEGKGIEIAISVPEGEEVAKSTYNPKLGIVGGISILGTTGIVNPMSEEAWKDSLELELKVLTSSGRKCLVYTFGNYGEDFTKTKLDIDTSKVIKISNFVGFMLDKAVEQNVDKILLIGHMGKLVKVSAGIFQTHSRIADARMEILTAYAALDGASGDILMKISKCKTTDAAVEIINAEGFIGVYKRIVENVSTRCNEYTYKKVNFGTVLFHSDNTLLCMDESAKELIEELK